MASRSLGVEKTVVAAGAMIKIQLFASGVMESVTIKWNGY